MVDDTRSPKCRDELRLYAYRMSGSLTFAESLIRELPNHTSGVSALSSYDERVRPYQIATGLCVESLRDVAPRGLPSWSQPPSGVQASVAPFSPESDIWLQPYPDELLPQAVCLGPRFDERESVSLEFTGALQNLKPWERAMLLLGDVMGLDEDQVAGVLTNYPGVALEDIRSEFIESYDRPRGKREPPSEKEASAILMRYTHFWEAGNIAGLEAMLADDVVFQSPPSSIWIPGKNRVKSHIESLFSTGEKRSRRRLLPVRANGQLAFGTYERDSRQQPYRAHSIHVIYLSGSAIDEMIVFRFPYLFPMFGLLPELVAQGE